MTPERYLFILGHIPALSVAEIYFFFRAPRYSFTILGWSNDALLVSLRVSPDIIAHIAPSLGGVIKVAHIRADSPSFDLSFAGDLLPSTTQKIFFGLSCYGTLARPPFLIAEVGKELKRRMRDAGISSRFVVSKLPTLSSVVVRTNKLLSARGVEIVLFTDQSRRWYYGRTIAVQSYDAYTMRDVGRPRRDAAVGMLPPKLAQMMIHYALGDAVSGAHLYDPFCGSGTVLTEAAVLGALTLFGSDRDPAALIRTEENFSWLRARHAFTDAPTLHTFRADIGSVHFDPSPTLDAVVTEPYLGPPRARRLSPHASTLLRRELSLLYRNAFSLFARLLTPPHRFVMVWPYWKDTEGATVFLDLVSDVTRNGFTPVDPLPEPLRAWYDDVQGYHPARRSLLYHRAGQQVFREIRIFEKHI